MSTDESLEPIASTSKIASKSLEGSAPLLPTGVKNTSRVFKPPVKSKGVVVPSSMGKGNGVETIASTLSQKKSLRLEAKQVKEGTSTVQSSVQVSHETK